MNEPNGIHVRQRIFEHGHTQDDLVLVWHFGAIVEELSARVT